MPRKIGGEILKSLFTEERVEIYRTGPTYPLSDEESIVRECQSR